METSCDSFEIHLKFKEVHQKLQNSYFDHFTNQRVCEEAMKMLWCVEVRDLSTALLPLSTMAREVLTHAHCNLQELHLIDEEIRHSCREEYWEEARKLYEKIFEEMDNVWDDRSSLQRLAIVLDFCTIFSYFKEYAEHDLMIRCQQIALEALHALPENATEKEKQDLKDYVDAIECAYVLRNELPYGKTRKSVKIEAPIVIVDPPQDVEVGEEEVPGKVGEIEETTMSEQYYDEPTGNEIINDEYYGEMMDIEMGDGEYEMEVEILANQQYTALISEETDYWTSNITLEWIADAIYLAAQKLSPFGTTASPVYQPARRQSSTNFLSNTELMRRLSIMDGVRIEPPHKDESDDEAETSALKPFDPLRVLEQHRRESQGLELPVIGRSPDMISSFRRRGLFDAPTLHRAREKRVSEGEAEARDSKGRRREDMEETDGIPVEIELVQCDTPMNTPYEPSNLLIREINAGVFEGLSIPVSQCDTPQNTPYSDSYLHDLPNHSLMD